MYVILGFPKNVCPKIDKYIIHYISYWKYSVMQKEFDPNTIMPAKIEAVVGFVYTLNCISLRHITL